MCRCGAAGSTGPNSIMLTATGSPAGGTYSWTTTSTKVTLGNTTSATVTVTSQAESGAPADVPITIAYTLNGQTGMATHNITVQKPTTLFLAAPGSTIAEFCVQGQAGPHREVDWQVKDKFGQPILFTGMHASDVNDLTVTSQNCNVGSLQTGTVNTTGSLFHDLYNMCSPVCGSGQSCQLNASQVYTVNGFRLSGDAKSVVYTCTQITINGQ